MSPRSIRRLPSPPAANRQSCGLGPLGDFLHSDRERVDLPSLVTRAQRAARCLHRFATGVIQLPE